MRTTASLVWALALLSACGGDDGNDGPVKIGMLAPKSGALGSVGGSFERVANTAIESINSKGGIGGRQIELLVDDTETNPDTVATKLQGLIDTGVIAVVGPATSGEVDNAWPVARDNRVPIVSPSSTAPFLSRPAPTGPDDQGYMFRNVPDDEIQGIAMAYYLYKLRTPSTVSSVAIVFENTAYGMGLKNAFKTAFEDLGGTVSLEVTHPQNLFMQDISVARAVIQQLADASTPPQMVVSVSLEKDTVKLVQAWDNGGVPMVNGMQWFLADGARSQGFLDTAPASMRGMCGTAPTYPITGLAFTQLRDAYEAKYDDSIDAQIYAPNVWDAFHLIAVAAVQQSRQHPDDDLGGPNLRDALADVSKGGQTFHAGQWRDLISALRSGNDVDYDGAGGPMDFDVVGQTVGPYEVWCLALDGTKFEQRLFLNATDIQKLLQ